MVTFLFFLTYFTIGYSTFRVWVRLNPPQKGPYDNEYLGGRGGDGWYIPAWMIKTQFNPYRNRGQSVGTVFWESVCGWPLLWSIGGGVLIADRLMYVARKVNKIVANMVVRHILPPDPPPESKLSEEMVAANLEVEEILTRGTL